MPTFYRPAFFSTEVCFTQNSALSFIRVLKALAVWALGNNSPKSLSRATTVRSHCHGTDRATTVRSHCPGQQQSAVTVTVQTGQQQSAVTVTVQTGQQQSAVTVPVQTGQQQSVFTVPGNNSPPSLSRYRPGKQEQNTVNCFLPSFQQPMMRILKSFHNIAFLSCPRSLLRSFCRSTAYAVHYWIRWTSMAEME